MRPIVLIAALIALLATVAAAPALGASRLVVRGAGFGHGIGMSQYGAFGFAEKGSDHAAILAHYYSGTTLAKLDGTSEVRVLLKTASRDRRSQRDQRRRRAQARPEPEVRRHARAERGHHAAQLQRPDDRQLQVAARRRRGERRLPAVRQERQRRRRRDVPRQPRGPRVGARRGVGDQRLEHRGLRPRRRRRRDAVRLAAGGAARAGGRRAHIRAGDHEGRRRLRPLRRHALAGLQRHRRRDRGRPTRRSPRRPARS